MIKIAASSEFDGKAQGVSIVVVDASISGTSSPREAVAIVCFTDAEENTASLHYPLRECQLRHSDDGKQYVQFPELNYVPEDRDSRLRKGDYRLETQPRP